MSKKEKAKEGSICTLNYADLARGLPNKDLGFRKIVCARCGKEFYTDIENKINCFECDREKR